MYKWETECVCSTDQKNQVAHISKHFALDEEKQALLEPFHFYKPYLLTEIVTDSYTLSSATCVNELAEIFRLRSHVFLHESESKEKRELEVDEFDFYCDHLMIRSNTTGELCGAYRVLVEGGRSKFYSSEEFDLTHFLAAPIKKVELGRVCIKPAMRNGILMDVLWRGLGQYLCRVKAEALFGCSSLKVTAPYQVESLLAHLQQKNLCSSDFQIQTREKYKMPFISGLKSAGSDHSNLSMEHMLPNLLLSYFNSGAKVYGEPAYDLDFNCVDLFTILFLKDVSDKFKKRYLEL